MVDLIDRQAVQEMVDRIGDIHPYRQIGNRESYSQYNEAWTDAINRVDAELNSLPSADIDLSDFSDKLWKTAYERGKAEAQAEIVRCKDCMYWVAHDKRCAYLNHGFAPNMWCCHGRRTDEKENI